MLVVSPGGSKSKNCHLQMYVFAAITRFGMHIRLACNATRWRHGGKGYGLVGTWPVSPLLATFMATKWQAQIRHHRFTNGATVALQLALHWSKGTGGAHERCMVPDALPFMEYRHLALGTWLIDGARTVTDSHMLSSSSIGRQGLVGRLIYWNLLCRGDLVVGRKRPAPRTLCQAYKEKGGLSSRQG